MRDKKGPKLELIEGGAKLDSLPWKQWGAVEKARNQMVERIAFLRANKGIRPILREDVKLFVRLNGARAGTKIEVNFRIIENPDFFANYVRPVVEKMEAKDPDGSIVMDTWLYPYEIGGSKLIPTIVIKAAALSKKVTTKNLKVVADVAKVVEITSAQAAEIKIVEETMATPEEVIDKDAIDLTPVELADRDWLNSAINFSHIAWRTYPTNQTLGKIRRVFEDKKIITPEGLLRFLGTNEPTRDEWIGFINKLNDGLAGPKILGASSIYELLRWMRSNKIIAADFKKD